MNYFNYFSEIEELFIRRRGRNLLLSPLDWALIETWQERAVPLHIILGAIEKVFDGVEKQPAAAQKRPIKSLTYCREEIETQHAAWLERQVGKNGDAAQTSESDVQSPESEDSNLFSGETIAAHFERVSAQLNDARRQADGKLRAVLDEVSKQLSAFESDWRTTENLERALEKLDELIDETLLEEFANDEAKFEIKKQLAAYRPNMEESVYERTFDLMLLKRLREQRQVPRLGLFYL